LENKLEDVYSIVQFLDPELLSPLWRFAADHFLLSRTTMTFLIGKHLSQAGIPFVELSGKVPVAKRQCLIDEFTNNAQCKVFLSTDAGGTGLNLQAADCVINFELPWNPAKLNQRVGRVNRIGQQSSCINVINLISKRSIEERILAGIKLKSALFDGVFDGGDSEVMFSREKRQELVNRLRELMGEEQEPIQAELMPTEELPDDTPHYLNPEALRDREPDYVGEEDFAAESPEDLSDAADLEDMGDQADRRDAPDARSAQQSPEKMEAVLNQGMAFISGLLEMATGQKIAAAEEGKMIELDKQTGEVTLKFTLPGFGRS
jgi:superfamily II DNA/RNA helicase